jgi:hypothetical protein
MLEIEDITISLQDYSLPFPHPGNWALNPDSCKFLGSLIDTLGVQSILELGSGYSSTIIAYELQKTNKGFLHSIDNSTNWSMKAKDFASKNQLSHKIAFHVFKLSLKVCPRIIYIFYDIADKLYTLCPIYDFVVIDGPHHDVGREGALYEIFSKVKVGGYFFVDDSRSDHMRATIEKWTLSFPTSITVRHFYEIGNGITIIKKICEANDEPYISPVQSFVSWIRALPNYMRLQMLKLND